MRVVVPFHQPILLPINVSFFVQYSFCTFKIGFIPYHQNLAFFEEYFSPSIYLSIYLFIIIIDCLFSGSSVSLKNLNSLQGYVSTILSTPVEINYENLITLRCMHLWELEHMITIDEKLYIHLSTGLIHEYFLVQPFFIRLTKYMYLTTNFVTNLW